MYVGVGETRDLQERSTAENESPRRHRRRRKRRTPSAFPGLPFDTYIAYYRTPFTGHELKRDHLRPPKRSQDVSCASSNPSNPVSGQPASFSLQALAPFRRTLCIHTFLVDRFWKRFISNVFPNLGDLRPCAQEGGGQQGEREKPELHTDLTTSAAITLYRSIVGSIIRIYVKVGRKKISGSRVEHCMVWLSGSYYLRSFAQPDRLPNQGGKQLFTHEMALCNQIGQSKSSCRHVQSLMIQ